MFCTKVQVGVSGMLKVENLGAINGGGKLHRVIQFLLPECILSIEATKTLF